MVRNLRFGSKASSRETAPTATSWGGSENTKRRWREATDRRVKTATGGEIHCAQTEGSVDTDA